MTGYMLLAAQGRSDICWFDIWELHRNDKVDKPADAKWHLVCMDLIYFKKTMGWVLANQ